MSNISFDNPWLLLIALPLIAAVVVPVCITVRRDNRNFHNVAATVLHVLICVCITLAISGMHYETVITDTQVFILADVSYSADHNLDDVQASVKKVSQNLPDNSKFSVICFGRDYQVISDMGDELPDVKSATKVDRSATDIGAALRVAGNMFDDGVIKRIIVITDGVETITTSNIVKVVGSLNDSGVYVDAVFINDNIDETVKELQIDSVEVSRSTYVNKDEEANVLIRVQSGNSDRIDGYLNIKRNGESLPRIPVTLRDGLNTVAVPLSTDTAGSYEYEITVEPLSAASDASPHNNVCYFTQNISEEYNVLYIGGSAADLDAGRKIYGTENVTYVSSVSLIPLSVEELCVYDEIVLCNFDVRTIRASSLFMASLSTIVNDYGKTLTTYGNTFIQEEQSDDVNSPLRQLQGLLPVRIGNYYQDKRLVALVLDISLSMNFSGRLDVAKRAAIEFINVLSNTDTVMVVGYSSVMDDFLLPTPLTARKAVIEKIQEKEVENGTSLSGALEYTYSKMPTRYQDRQVVIITDGLFTATDKSAAYAQVRNMTQNNITVSALGIYPSDSDSSFLNRMIYNGNENENTFYKPINSEKDIDVTLKDLNEDVQQVRIDDEGLLYKVTARRTEDEVMKGVGDLGYVDGFWCNKEKTQASVKVVLTAEYFRDKITSFNVPIYAYWDGGGGKGKVVSFLSDITSDWARGWYNSEDGAAFFANIPSATLPNERIVQPFLVSVDGQGNDTTVSVQTSNALLDSTSFTVSLTDPDGLVTTRSLTFDSSLYFTTFATDAPGIYKLRLNYAKGDLKYEMETEFSISYYSEYDSFTSYSKSYLYRLLSSNGNIYEPNEITKFKNTDSEFSTYSLSFTLPLMIICAILLIIDIVIRQLKWKDITSFFSGLRRRK